MRRLAPLLLLAILPAQAPAPPQAPPPVQPQDPWLPKTTADLILLDKIRAQPTPLSVKVGDTASFGSMTLRVTACFARPPDQPADSTAFLDVSDPRAGTQKFRGWIFANTPAISQIEDPVYDVRLAQCH